MMQLALSASTVCFQSRMNSVCVIHVICIHFYLLSEIKLLENG